MRATGLVINQALGRHKGSQRRQRRAGVAHVVGCQVERKRSTSTTLIGTAQPDVLAYIGFPAANRVKFRSRPSSILRQTQDEGLNGQIKLQAEVVGIFPHENAVTRLVEAILLEQNDEWVVQRSLYMPL